MGIGRRETFFLHVPRLNLYTVSDLVSIPQIADHQRTCFVAPISGVSEEANQRQFFGSIARVLPWHRLHDH